MNFIILLWLIALFSLVYFITKNRKDSSTEAKKYLTGYSLSSCIEDIVLNRVDINDVEVIYTNTAFLSASDAVDYYTDSGMWKSVSKMQYFRVVNRLWPRIQQPRLKLFNNSYYNSYKWTKTVTGEIVHVR